MMKVNPEKYLVFLIGLLLPVSLLEFKAFTIGQILLLLYLPFRLLKNRKFKVDPILLCILVVGVITVLINLVGNMGRTWKVTSLRYFFYWISVFLFSGCWSGKPSRQFQIKFFLSGLTWGCILNVIWGYIQIAAYNINATDINDKLFSGRFGRSDVSALKGSEVLLSGLGWHSAQMIPVLIFLFLTFDNIYLQFVVLGAALLTQSSTCIFAMLLCVAAKLLLKRSEKIQFDRKSFLIILSAVIVLILLFRYVPALSEQLDYNISRLFGRLQSASDGTAHDKSTRLHLRYYTSYPEIISKNALHFLFGYGLNCSGYPFTVLYGQYTNIGAWITESDVINFLLGNGIFGASLIYAWLLRIGVKGWKISYKYMIFSLCIISAGFLYNLQFYWVLILEAVMEYAVDYKINIFNYQKIFSGKKHITADMLKKYILLIMHN